MAFCGYCGAEMPDDMSFCTECGKPLNRKKDQSIQSIFDSLPVEHEKSTIDPEECDIHNTPHLHEQNKTAEVLYQTLKDDERKRNESEKKGFILPLVLTLVFALIAVTVFIIKFKPYEKLINRNEDAETLVEQDQIAKTEDEKDDNPVTMPAQISDVKPSNVSYEEPEIKDMQACFRPINPYFDYVYIDYYYEVYNPNSDVMITFLQLTWNVRDASNAILGTDTASINLIMPEETVYVFGTIMLTKSEAAIIASDDTQYEWDYSTESRYYSPISYSDIVVSNISARGSGYDAKVTGEIANNSLYDTSAFTTVYAIYRKGDDLVAIESAYVDPIYSGSSRVFEIKGYHDTPDYDTVQIFVDVW